MIRLIVVVLAGALLGGVAVHFFSGRDVRPGVADAWSVSDGIDALNAQVSAAPALDAIAIEAVFRDWGARDIDAALRALADIESPIVRRSAALALLDVIGDDAAAAERVASALPGLERPGFRADWLGRRARTDPAGAFRELFGLASELEKRMAAEKIALAWAAQDPQGALSEAFLLPDDLASEFRRNVLTAWARLDAGAVFDYLATGDPNPLEIVGALGFLAADPDGLMAVADRRGDQFGLTLEISALSVLAESDPQRALGRVESMPAGPQRDQAVMMVAMVYALADPDAATDWIERMLPASPNSRMLVAMGLAEQNPVGALDMLTQGPASQETQLMLGLVMQTTAQDSGRARSLAEELAQRRDMQSRGLLANLMSSWAQRDADAAVAWVIGSDAELDPSVLGNAAASMAGRDLAAAVDYVERIPPRYRDSWITRVAGPYGRNDLDAAVNWIEQYRGQAVYEQAYGQLLAQAASSNPEAAAQLMLAAAAEVQQSAATAVATTWAQRDAPAAAQWAQTLSDPQARESATGRVIQVLAQRSPDEARALLNTRVSDAGSRQRIAELAGLDQAP